MTKPAADVVQLGELEGCRLGLPQATGVEQARKGGLAPAPGDGVLAAP